MEQKRWILLFLVAIQSLILHAQIMQISFEVLNTTHGLSSNNITCLYQDKQGFLWIGTDFGLNRYDGNIFIHYYSEINNSNSLSGNYIADIIEDAEGIFWIATKDGGLTRFDPKATKEKQFNRFIHLDKDSSSIPTNRLITLFDYDDNYILIGAEVYPYIFINKKDFTITTRKSANLEPYFPKIGTGKENEKSDWMHKIKFLDGKYFISNLYNGKIYIYDKNGKCLSHENNISNSSSVTDFILVNDTLWLASWWQGLYIKKLKYRAGSDTIDIVNDKLLDINDNITCILQMDDNIVLAGSLSSGLFLVSTHTHTYINERSNILNSFSIPSNNINCLFKDNQENIWIGTRSGLAKYNPRKWNFEAYPFTSKDAEVAQVFSVHSSDDHTIRICTSNGIYKKSNTANTFESITFTYGKNFITPNFIFEYTPDQIYLGTELNLYKYDYHKEQIDPVPITLVLNIDGKEIFQDGTGGVTQIRSIIADTIDAHPVLLMEVLGSGMGVLDITNNYAYYLIRETGNPNSIKNNMTRSIYKDLNGNIWAGSSEGLFEWQKSFPPQNIFKSFVFDPYDSSSISHNSITGICMDSKRHIWVSTLGGGLNMLTDSGFIRLYSGIPEGNNMFGVYPDNKGRLWCPVKFGFEVYDPEKQSFFRIVLPSEEFTMRYNSKLFIDDNGDFLYASPSTFVRLDPESWNFESTFPQIYLRDILLFNNSLKYSDPKKLVLKHNENFITFLFSALDLTGSSPPIFQYRLSGISDIWLPVSMQDKLTFNSLPFGEYVLELRVSNIHGQWSEPYVLSAFKIIRPFWLQWWFYIIVIAAATVFTISFIKYRETEIKKIQNVRNKIANDLHDDIGSALSTIGLYTEVAKIKADDANKELHSLLEKISITSQEMQENMNHIVWSLQPRNDAFEQVVLRLKVFAAEALSAKDIAVEFHIGNDMDDLKLSSEQRKELFLIFKEAINNIIKYAQCNRVEIYFSIQKNIMVMRIKDNGVGFEIDKLKAGNGLHTMKERANTLRGNIYITSEPGKGTDVWLKFEA